jgi:hypothetical protein
MEIKKSEIEQALSTLYKIRRNCSNAIRDAVYKSAIAALNEEIDELFKSEIESQKNSTPKSYPKKTPR